MGRFYRDGNHEATVERKEARRAVTAGRASWVFCAPGVGSLMSHPEMPSGPPVAPKRVPLTPTPTNRVFGQGLGERYPIYRAPVDLADMQWWSEQAAIEEDREVERMYQEFRANERMALGLEPW